MIPKLNKAMETRPLQQPPAGPDDE
jgi:hypothetical protein